MAEAAPSLSVSFPPFRPRLPWWGPDLQTLRNTLLRPRIDLSGFPAQTLRFSMDDGDVLIGRLHRPAESAGRPLAVLIHGLSGSEDSAYMHVTARRLLLRGFPVLRLNLRGAGPSRPLCRNQYHAGRSEDFRAVLDRLPAASTADGIVAVGFSMGGAMLLKHLGESGADSGLMRAVAVCAPIDLVETGRSFDRVRNRPYNRYLLNELKRNFLQTPDLGPQWPGIVAGIARMYDFDDRVVAPLNGFASAHDYQTRSSAAPLIGKIRTPTLAIHADDDPWIPLASYRAADWSGGSARLLLARGGGHLGFHQAGGTWHDDCLTAFLEAA